MKINTTEEIKTKYGYDTKMLLLHYTAIAGELPTQLIRTLGIKVDNQKYIFNRSNFKDFFINKRKANLCGYQLKSAGVDYLLNSEYSDNYYIYLINSNNNRRKITTNLIQRQRYQDNALLLYQLDKVGINYFNSGDIEQIFFLTSGRIKQSLNNSNTSFIGTNEQHEIKSSRLLGALKTENKIYTVYVFRNDIIQLDYSTELRANTMINISEKNNNGSETIIITNNTNSQCKIVKELFECRYSGKDKYKDKKYKIFKDRVFSKIHVLSFDDTGTYQLSLLKTKKEIEEKIKKSLLRYNKENDKHINKGLMCDMYLNNFPVEFLYTMEVNKLRYFYDLVSEQRDMGGYIVCMSEHHNFISDIFADYLSRVKILNLEDILDLK